MSGIHARHIDPGPLIPTMKIQNAKGETIIVNAEPVFDGDEDHKPSVKAHAKAVKEHQRSLAEWAKAGYAPAPKVEAPADDEGEEPEVLEPTDEQVDDSSKPVGRGRKAKPAQG